MDRQILRWRRNEKAIFFREKSRVEFRPKKFSLPDNIQKNIDIENFFYSKTENPIEFTAYARVRLKNILWAYHEVFNQYPDTSGNIGMSGLIKGSHVVLKNINDLEGLENTFVMPDLHIREHYLDEIKKVTLAWEKKFPPANPSPDNESNKYDLLNDFSTRLNKHESEKLKSSFNDFLGVGKESPCRFQFIDCMALINAKQKERLFQYAKELSINEYGRRYSTLIDEEKNDIVNLIKTNPNKVNNSHTLAVDFVKGFAEEDELKNEIEEWIGVKGKKRDFFSKRKK